MVRARWEERSRRLGRVLERKQQAEPAAAPARPRPPPVRLRFVLLFLVLGLGIHLLAPRALAHWRLHGAATEFANYALCMAGPTGPGLLRDQPSEFWRRVRRRLVASEPGLRPFAACSKVLSDVEQNVRRRAAHAARADEFAEYARYEAGEAPRFTLSELMVTTEPLERLLAESQPFGPGDYADLVRPSLGAVSAPHPVELPLAGRGRGLPAAELSYGSVVRVPGGYLLVEGRDVNLEALRSLDGGKTWSAADSDLPAIQALGNQCTVGEGAPQFRLSSERGALQIETWASGAQQAAFPVANGDSALIGFSCDRESALALVLDERHARLSLKLCPSSRPCRVLKRPGALSLPQRAGVSLSAVRVRGITVIALGRDGIVRITSSRDDGESWTPLVVAYDRAEEPVRRGADSVPTRLLALDARVLLYGTPSGPNGDYPLLASDDFGASWHTP